MPVPLTFKSTVEKFKRSIKKEFYTLRKSDISLQFIHVPHSNEEKNILQSLCK
jgi:hypothetical protein